MEGKPGVEGLWVREDHFVGIPEMIEIGQKKQNYKNMSQTILFPEISDNSIHSYREVLQQYQRVIKENAGALIGMTFTKEIKPLGSILLTCIIHDLLFRQIQPLVLQQPHPGKQPDEYLKEVEFYKNFRLIDNNLGLREKKTMTIPVRLIKKMDLGYIEEIPYWLGKKSGADEEIIRQSVQINLVEAINNVIDHSGSPFGCYVHGYGYKTPPIMILVIMDFGMGFLKSLKRDYPEIKDDVTAITSAVEKGYSSKMKSEKRPRGAGLSHIRDFMKSTGKLEVVSGNGRWVQELGGKISTEQLRFHFPGSYLFLQFDINKLGPFIDSSDLDDVKLF